MKNRTKKALKECALITLTWLFLILIVVLFAGLIALIMNLIPKTILAIIFIAILVIGGPYSIYQGWKKVLEEIPEDE